MAQCEVCGNNYYLSFEVVTAGNRHVFDCFECAIHKLAPVCAHSKQSKTWRLPAVTTSNER